MIPPEVLRLPFSSGKEREGTGSEFLALGYAFTNCTVPSKQEAE